jgi:uncharacterized protein (DUF2336 family)
MAAIASAEIIIELERTVRACPPARCALIMRRVTELLVRNADRLEGAQFEVFDDILIRLMDRVEIDDLARLSDALAYLAPARLKIVGRLAHHEQAEVASPILQKSDAIPDADLVEVVQCRGPAHAVAIAKRRSLGEAVTDALLMLGDTNVCVELVKSGGTRFSREGYAKLVAMAERNDELADLMVRRPDVPAAPLHELLAKLPRSVRARLLKIATPELHETMHAAIESIETGICRRAPEAIDYAEAQARVLELNNLGKLNDSTVNRFAVWRENRNLVAALSLLATVPIETIETLLSEGDDYGLIVACRASRLNWNTAQAVISNRPDRPAPPADEIARARVAFDALNLSAAQRMLRFGSIDDFASKLKSAEPPAAARAV